jgi:hypothetical protein
MHISVEEEIMSRYQPIDISLLYIIEHTQTHTHSCVLLCTQYAYSQQVVKGKWQQAIQEV